MSQMVKAVLGAFVAVMTAAAAAEAQPRMPTHVACVGDSITAGTGSSSSSTNYPGDLQSLFGSSVQVRNFGVSGATMLTTGDKPYVNQANYTSATTFVSGAGASAVVDVIIMLGTNDSKPANWNAASGGTQANQFTADCGKLIDHFATLATHPAIYLALPPTAGTNTYKIDGTVIKNQIIPILKQVATQKAIATIDVQTPTASVPSDFGDGVHPNDTGYVLVARTMHDGLLRVPTVSITSPASGSTVAGPSVGISADASGGTVAIKTVEFLRGTTSIATATQSPFSASWSGVAPGSYTLSAKATDTTGASATSATVPITVSGSSAEGGSGPGGIVGTAGAGGAAGGSGTGDAGNPGTGGYTGSGGVATGGSGSGGSPSGGVPGATASGGHSATGGQPGSTGGTTTGAGDSGSGSGCTCTIPSRRPTPPAALLALFALTLISRKRRR